MYPLVAQGFQMFVITTNCPNFSFQKFPFDILDCSIILSASEAVSEMEYYIKYFRIGHAALSSFIGPTEIWSLIPDSLTHSVTNLSEFENWQVSNIELSIKFQRRYQFYIAQIFFPQVGLFALQLCTLILPAEMAERPGFSMTVVLAFSLLLDMIFKQIPRTTETVYVVVMTVIKLVFSILLTIYMLTTCTVTNVRKEMSNRIRQIDKITAVSLLVLSISIDMTLLYLMTSK